MYRPKNRGSSAQDDTLEDRADALLTWLEAGRGRSRSSDAPGAAATLSSSAAAEVHQASWQATHANVLPGFKCH
jgi:hypothetical protein